MSIITLATLWFSFAENIFILYFQYLCVLKGRVNVLQAENSWILSLYLPEFFGFCPRLTNVSFSDNLNSLLARQKLYHLSRITSCSNLGLLYSLSEIQVTCDHPTHICCILPPKLAPRAPLPSRPQSTSLASLLLWECWKHVTLHPCLASFYILSVWLLYILCCVALLDNGSMR